MSSIADVILGEQPRLRIALVTPYDLKGVGGVNSHVLDLRRALQERGHKATVVGPFEEQPPLEDVLRTSNIIREVKNGGAISRVADIPGGLLTPKFRHNLDAYRKSVDTLIETLKTEYDVVHVHDPGAPPFNYWLVSHLDGSTLNVGTFHASGKDGVKRTLYRWYLKHRGYLRQAQDIFDHRFAVSSIAMEYSDKRFPGEYEIVPNPVDTDWFTPEGPELTGLQGRPLNDGKTTILFLGRLGEPRKGLRYLAEAYGALQQTDVRDKVRLIIAGPGDLDSATRAVLGRISENRYVIAGPVPAERLPSLYRTADIFVAPSTGNESQGIIINEAQACGIAVIASDIDGYVNVGTRMDITSAMARSMLTPIPGNKPIPDIMEGGGIWYFEPKNSLQLAAGLHMLVQSPVIREHLAAEGLKNAQQFSLKAITDRVEGRYYEKAAEKLPTSLSACL